VTGERPSGVAGPERLAEAAAAEWDLVVVGGGAIGTAVARAAAMAGLRTLLLERYDFGWGTTSRSTRLIHGGLRYLPMFDFGLVREDLRERETLLQTADHLVKPIRFLYPLILPFIDNWTLAQLRLWAGMVAYDVLSFDKSLPRHHIVGRREALELAPGLDPLRTHGGAQFYDAQIEWAERLCVEQALDAGLHGGLALTHVSVEQVQRSHGRVAGVRARGDASVGGDDSEVTIRAARIINTGGPWVDELVAASGAGPTLQRLSMGIHLVGPRLEMAPLIAPLSDDPERVLFVVPWASGTLVGTTDTPFDGTLDRPRLAASDVAMLRGQLHALVPGASDWTPWYGIAGIRSLGDKAAVAGWRPGEGATSVVSRKPLVVDHRRFGFAGLFSLAGGKLTGHRSIAGDLLHAAFPRLAHAQAYPRDPLPGAFGDEDGTGRRVDASGGRRPVALYGSRADAVVRSETSPVISGLDDVTHAELENAVRAEGARTLTDVVQRRVMLGHGQDLGVGAAEALAPPLADMLGWGRSRLEAEWVRYTDEIADRRLPEVGVGAVTAGVRTGAA
jgi:glycerol-3-phosphate dehydrogenase